MSGNWRAKFASGAVWNPPSAQLHNKLVDVAVDFDTSQVLQRPGRAAGRRAEGLVLVRNDSGSDLTDIGILGINSVIFTSAQNAAAYKYGVPTFTCGTPTAPQHIGEFVVTYGPLAKGVIGPAFMFGVCCAPVNVVTVGDNYADITTGDATQLKSGPVGSVQIIDAPGATGKQSCLVRMGLRQIPGVEYRVNLTQTGGSTGTQTTTASWVYTAALLSGANVGTSLSPEDPRPNGTRAAATAGIGYFNASNVFVLSRAFEKPGTGHC
jgi:hypothetical protein